MADRLTSWSQLWSQFSAWMLDQTSDRRWRSVVRTPAGAALLEAGFVYLVLALVMLTVLAT